MSDFSPKQGDSCGFRLLWLLGLCIAVPSPGPAFRSFRGNVARKRGSGGLI
jgi:hypothetical protein